MVPPHSFSQIFLPMRIDSARVRSMALAGTTCIAKPKRTNKWRTVEAFRDLDGTLFSVSVHTSAALWHGSDAAFFRIIVMKKSPIFFAAVLLASTGFSQQTTQLKDEKDKVSYSIGLDIGNTFKKQKMDINTDVLMAGLKDALSGAKPLLTEDQVKETMAAFSKSMIGKTTGDGERRRREKRRGRGEVSCGEQDQGRRENNAERVAIQGAQGRQRRVAEGD